MDLESTKGVVLSEVIEYRHLFPEEKSLDIKNILIYELIFAYVYGNILIVISIGNCDKYKKKIIRKEIRLWLQS